MLRYSDRRPVEDTAAPPVGPRAPQALTVAAVPLTALVIELELPRMTLGPCSSLLWAD